MNTVYLHRIKQELEFEAKQNEEARRKLLRRREKMAAFVKGRIFQAITQIFMVLV